MEERLVKEAVSKADLIKYTFNNDCKHKLWCANYMLDSTDRELEVMHILNDDYNLSNKVYLYKSIRNQFKLVAIITKKGVKKL